MKYIYPKCKSKFLSFNDSAYKCEECSLRYPIIVDIPDFRVNTYPYSNQEENDVAMT